MSQNFPPRLEALVRTIERELYSHPKSVIEPLRQLLQQCEGSEQLCYAYEHLGFAHLLLGEHRMSKIFYEHALHLQPDNVYVLANLAHAVYELGERASGVEYGRRALALKDQGAMTARRRNVAKPHLGSTNLIAFSLYGNRPRYCETAILNCVAASRHFPGFVCRFYVHPSVPGDVIRRLRGHGAEIVPVAGQAASFPPTFWRFLAIDDRSANIVLVRDADSLIDAREAYCVNEWIASGKAFHIIRDDCCHTELIHAGLFAAKSGIVEGIERQIADFLAAEESQPVGRFSDQLFLRRCVWPAVREQAVTHDSVYRYGTDVRDIPHEPGEGAGLRNQFIGANYASYCLRISAPATFAEDGVHLLRILDEAGAIVCEYPMDPVNGRELQIFLPQSYAKRIEAATWGYEVYAENARTRSRAVIARSSPPLPG